jgi:hypothetical protein
MVNHDKSLDEEAITFDLILWVGCLPFAVQDEDRPVEGVGILLLDDAPRGPQRLGLALPRLQAAVERLHELHSGLRRDLPEADDHAAGARVEEGPREVRDAFALHQLPSAGGAGREHHQISIEPEPQHLAQRKEPVVAAAVLHLAQDQEGFPDAAHRSRQVSVRGEMEIAVLPQGNLPEPGLAGRQAEQHIRRLGFDAEDPRNGADLVLGLGQRREVHFLPFLLPFRQHGHAPETVPAVVARRAC